MKIRINLIYIFMIISVSITIPSCKSGNSGKLETEKQKLEDSLKNRNELINKNRSSNIDSINNKNKIDSNHNQRANYYYEPEISVLSGILRSQKFYGPPNYGETPKIDRIETFYILILDSPINVLSKKNDEFNEPERNIRDIQLVILDYSTFRTYLNKSIRVSGKLFHSETGHHHTKVLMEDVNILM